MRKRNLLIAFCAVVAVGGFGAGFASLGRHHHHRRVAFERHVAQLCTDAALRADRARTPRPAPREPWGPPRRSYE